MKKTKTTNTTLKIIFTLIILFLFLFISIFSFKYFFPEEYNNIKTKAKINSLADEEKIINVEQSTTNVTINEAEKTTFWDAIKTIFIFLIVGCMLSFFIWLFLKDRGVVKKTYSRKECEKIAIDILNEDNKFTRLSDSNYTIVDWRPFVEGDENEPWYAFFFILGEKVMLNQDPKTIPHNYWFIMEMSRIDPNNDNTGLRQMTTKTWEKYVNDKYFKRVGMSYKKSTPPGLLDEFLGESELAFTKRVSKEAAQ
jgi:hypothetical protein